MKYIMIAIMAVASASAMAAPKFPFKTSHPVSHSTESSDKDAKSSTCLRSVKLTPPRCD